MHTCLYLQIVSMISDLLLHVPFEKWSVKFKFRCFKDNVILKIMAALKITGEIKRASS